MKKLQKNKHLKKKKMKLTDKQLRLLKVFKKLEKAQNQHPSHIRESLYDDSKCLSVL